MLLDKEGITSSQANRIANMIKEIIKDFDITTNNFKISSARFSENESWHMLDNNVKIEDWDSKILDKGEYYGLSSWLREAIKFKDNLCSSIQNETCSLVGIKVEGEPPVKNVDTFPLDFEYYKLNILNASELAEFLYADAKATHIGKFIHSYDDIRADFANYKPTTFENISADKTITVSNTLLYDETEMNEKVKQLTAKHSVYDTTCNMYKARHKEWVANQELNRLSQTRKYNEEVYTYNKNYEEIISKHRSEFEKSKIERLEEARSLKITVPEQFAKVFASVSEKLVD